MIYRTTDAVMTSWTIFGFLYLIMTIAGFLLLRVFSVTDHRGHQNMVRTSLRHSANGSCSISILTSSVIYFWTDARQHGIDLSKRTRNTVFYLVNKSLVSLSINQFHFNSQLNIDLSSYGTSLSVPRAVFSDKKSSRVCAIVYRTLQKVLRLRNEESGNDTSSSNIISATILPRPKNPLRKEIKLVFNHINQVLVINCCSSRLQLNF